MAEVDYIVIKKNLPTPNVLQPPSSDNTTKKNKNKNIYIVISAFAKEVPSHFTN
jgi:hypothetical protein